MVSEMHKLEAAERNSPPAGHGISIGDRVEFTARLRARLKGKVLLVGIGNTLRGDDGAGSKLIELLDGKVDADLLDVGEVPESYTGRILAGGADTVVLLDAADWGAAAGQWAILEPQEFADRALSTHQLSLRLLCRFIQENSSAEVLALGIQAAQIGLGKAMSAAVSESVQNLAVVLGEIMGD